MANSKRRSAKEFIGSNMREALAKLKKEFGSEAVIYSQEKKNGKVHLLAGSDDDFQAVLEQNIAKQESSPATSAAISRSIDQYTQTALKTNKGSSANTTKKSSQWVVEENALENVRHELSEIKTMLRDQLAGLIWQEQKMQNPVVVSVVRKMQELEFSVDTVKKLLKNLPEDLYLNQAIQHALVELYDNIEVDLNVFNEQRFKLFVGPSGVGKTNLLLNLLLTITKGNILTDFAVVCVNQKLTGLEESKIFKRVFNVPSYYCDSPRVLQATLNKLKNINAVFIDYNIHPSSEDCAAYKEVLQEFTDLIDTNLVTSTSTSAENINMFVSEYLFSGTQSLSITKLDEHTLLGAPLSCAVNNNIPLRFINASNNLGESFIVINKEAIIKALVEQVTVNAQKPEEETIWKFAENEQDGTQKRQQAS